MIPSCGPSSSAPLVGVDEGYAAAVRSGEALSRDDAIEFAPRVTPD
jgi:hypothetical protein